VAGSISPAHPRPCAGLQLPRRTAGSGNSPQTTLEVLFPSSVFTPRASAGRRFASLWFGRQVVFVVVVVNQPCLYRTSRARWPGPFFVGGGGLPWSGESLFSVVSTRRVRVVLPWGGTQRGLGSAAVRYRRGRLMYAVAIP
jgi:hypothetical protein